MHRDRAEQGFGDQLAAAKSRDAPLWRGFRKPQMGLDGVGPHPPLQEDWAGEWGEWKKKQSQLTRKLCQENHPFVLQISVFLLEFSDRSGEWGDFERSQEVGMGNGGINMHTHSPPGRKKSFVVYLLIYFY